MKKKQINPLIKFLKYWAWYWYFRYYIWKDKTKTAMKYPGSNVLPIAYKAMRWALDTHHGVRQSYDGYPYFFHLNEVSKVAIKWREFAGNNFNTFLGALFHDVIEDARLTYNDVKELWGQEVADIVFVCTEIRGKNRKERHGPFYFKSLKQNKLGMFVKICDTIANMERGLTTGSTMLNKYMSEYKHFKQELYCEEYKQMFVYIEHNIVAEYERRNSVKVIY